MHVLSTTVPTTVFFCAGTYQCESAWIGGGGSLLVLVCHESSPCYRSRRENSSVDSLVEWLVGRLHSSLLLCFYTRKSGRKYRIISSGTEQTYEKTHEMLQVVDGLNE